jgi:hypothetical protein
VLCREYQRRSLPPTSLITQESYEIKIELDLLDSAIDVMAAFYPGACEFLLQSSIDNSDDPLSGPSFSRICSLAITRSFPSMLLFGIFAARALLMLRSTDNNRNVKLSIFESNNLLCNLMIVCTPQIGICCERKLPS